MTLAFAKLKSGFNQLVKTPFTPPIISGQVRMILEITFAPGSFLPQDHFCARTDQAQGPTTRIRD